jgi:hypothetical protein
MQEATALHYIEPVEVAESDTKQYARCVKASKRVRWDIDKDVIRGRTFDFDRTFLPAGLSKADELEFLDTSQRRLLSQVQGRSYAYLFGLVERFIGAKVLQLSGQHWLGDQVALEALVRFSDEEIKHQELFRRLEALMDERMAPGYRMVADPNAVARAVLGKRTWAVLALICRIELFVQKHFEESIAPEANLCPLWKDVFFYHWKEECQHAVLDELEWKAENARIDDAERDRAVDDLIDLVAAVDGILQAQSASDVDYFIAASGASFDAEQQQRLREGVLRAYRWQYIVSGVQHPRFSKLLSSMTTTEQLERIVKALTPILQG